MAPLDVRDQSWGVVPVLSRRRFLGAVAAGSGGLAIASLLAACSPAAPAGAPQQPAPTAAANTAAQPAQAGPAGFANAGTLKILMSSHFVPAYDTWFDQWAKDWGAKNKVEVQADHIL
jgi:ABC-type phosphate transport system substrate-binding protein